MMPLLISASRWQPLSRRAEITALERVGEQAVDAVAVHGDGRAALRPSRHGMPAAAVVAQHGHPVALLGQGGGR